MKTNIRPVFLLIALLSFSCAAPHYYYSPNIQNVPLFKGKGEFTALAAGSFGLVNQSFEAQAAYSLTGHLAVAGGFMKGGNDNSSDSWKDYSKISYYEASAGYFRSFRNYGVMGIYGGYGKGSQDHAYSFSYLDNLLSWGRSPDGQASLSFSRIFIQPALGVKARNIEGAVSCRIGRIKYNDIRMDNVFYHSDELNTLSLNNPPWFLEPAFTFRGGSRSVKLQIQTIFSLGLIDPGVPVEKVRINIGLFFCPSLKRSPGQYHDSGR